MRKLLLIFTFFTCVSYGVEYCADNYKCIVKKDREDPSKENLECTLSNMPTFPIIAKDVFDANGSLRNYFGSPRKNVCNVLGWMNNAIPYLDNFEGLKKDITTPLKLVFKHLNKSMGGATTKGSLSLDSDRVTIKQDPNDFYDDDLPDGNRHMNQMQYITVHEFLHFISINSIGEGKSWVAEGTARAFEDMVYDTENPYATKAYSPMYEKNFIANILEDNIRNESYKTFAFFKLLKDKCTVDLSKLLLENADISRIGDTCHGLPNINNNKLASLFFYYNWAMLLQHNFKEIDSNEPVYSNLFEGVLPKVNQKDFKNTLDMKDKVDTILPPYSAKSFLITHETLANSGDMNLTFKSNGDLKLIAVRVKADGSSDVNDNFVMDSNTQFYKLTEVDRAGGLFITLVNTTGGEIGVEELNLTKEELGVVIDKAAGLMWQDKYEGRSKFHYGAYSTVSYYCSNLSLANYNDWRVPSVHELEKMYNTGLVSKFTNTLSRERWSSTFSHVDNGWGASSWYFTFDFSTGKISESKYRNKEFIICVRDL